MFHDSWGMDAPVQSYYVQCVQLNKPDIGAVEFYNQRLYVIICYTLDVSVAYLQIAIQSKL